ncbi:MAG TPA: CoA transferase [Geminicoccaceae bacterium]|nr:CoA transferase [Geminicoccaceae bacterium]
MTETPEQLKAYEPEAAAPLDGVRVLDLSRLLAGNILTHGLADFGAEVIKVERPGKGDDLRHWTVKGVPTYWKVFCRNKKSVTLDLRRDEGRGLLLRLVETAAVLVENFRPGTLEGWGLGPDDVLLRRNPRLVVVRISGWGQTGPFRHKPGYGSLVEAMSGYAGRTGFPDGPPVLPPIALADSIAGYYGAMATLVALREAEVRGGRGQVLDLSLFEPIFSILGPEAANYRLTGRVPRRLGNRSVDTAPRNLYRCKDGRYVALSASRQGMAERVFHAIGRPELIDDPRFRTNADRVANGDALDAIVAAFMAGRTQAEAVAFFEAADVTAGPVSDIAGLVDHPYVREREIIAGYPDEDMGVLPMHGVPGRLSATPGRMRAPAPKLGEHTGAVLEGIGVGAARREELAAAGVI